VVEPTPFEKYDLQNGKLPPSRGENQNQMIYCSLPKRGNSGFFPVTNGFSLHKTNK